MPVIEITTHTQFTDYTESDPLVLLALYFHTPWAGPCKTMNAVFKTLADSKSDDPSILFLSINADDQPDIAELFEVSAVPYFILVRNSTILKELSGADPQEFVAALNEFSGSTSTTLVGNGGAQANSTGASASTTTATPTESLDDRLTKLVAAAPIMLFMKGSPSSPQCGFSRQLVAILREHQVRFGFFDILKDDNVRQGLKKFSDWPTFPQLYMNGEFQGGLDIIKESIEEDPQFFENATAQEA